MTNPPEDAATRVDRDERPSESSPHRGSELEPGRLLAERFRIVAEIGSGGMGTVYRAEDLQLRQDVALKLVSGSWSEDPRAADALLGEVRLARRVSHPYVCRVHDARVLDGRMVLTMEYVAGEDLESLLRRVGRLDLKKAQQLACQIGAGLAAVHARDIVHRDLKAANILVDEVGHARLTDFGVARTGEELESKGSAALAGSLLTMAPELLSGGLPSPRTDVFSLGCVLHQLFTGKAPFDATSLEELKAEHRRGPTALAEGHAQMPPELAVIVARCLAVDPERRPATVLEALDGLPGFDPLAESLASGMTPSPQLVASGSSAGALGRGLGAVLCVVAMVAAVFCVRVLDTTGLASQASLQLGPDVLRVKAREHLAALGLDQPPGLRSHGDTKSAGVDLASPLDRVGRFQLLPAALEPREEGAEAASVADTRSEGPGNDLLTYWYRESELRPLIPIGTGIWLDWDDPPASVPGERSVRLSLDGRLLELRVVPHDLSPEVAVERSGTPSASNYAGLLARAGLDLDLLAPAASRGSPPVYIEDRQSWKGPDPTREGAIVHVDAGLRHGRPAWFRIQDIEVAADSVEPGVARSLTTAIVLLAVGLTGWLAFVAHRRRRSDHLGAFRLAIFVLLTAGLAAGCLRGNPFDVNTSVELWSGAFMRAAGLGLMCYIAYLGLESQIRRFWPHSVVSWTRMLTGRLQDSLVASHWLVGMAIGAIAAVLEAAAPLVQIEVGEPARPVFVGNITCAALSGTTAAIGASLVIVVHSLCIAGAGMMAVVVARMLLLRRRLAALVATCLMFGLLLMLRGMPVGMVNLTLVLIQAIALVLAAYRSGLLGMWAGTLLFKLLTGLPMSSSSERWYSSVSMAVVALTCFTGFLALRALWMSRSRNMSAAGVVGGGASDRIER